MKRKHWLKFTDLPIHVQSVDLDSRYRHLTDTEVHLQTEH